MFHLKNLFRFAREARLVYMAAGDTPTKEPAPKADVIDFNNLTPEQLKQVKDVDPEFAQNLAQVQKEEAKVSVEKSKDNVGGGRRGEVPDARSIGTLSTKGGGEVPLTRDNADRPGSANTEGMSPEQKEYFALQNEFKDYPELANKLATAASQFIRDGFSPQDAIQTARDDYKAPRKDQENKQYASKGKTPKKAQK